MFPAGTADGPRDAGRASAKDMVFWLHYDPTSPTVNGKATQLTFNTSMYWTKTNYTIDGDKNLQMDFYLVPTLAADVTVDGTVTVGFWGNYSGSNNNFQVQLIFYERNSTGNENWTSTTYSANYNPASAPQYYSFDCSGFQHTFASGSTVRLNLQVTGGSGIYKAVYIDTGTNNSRIVFPCKDYLDVPGINTFDYLGNPQAGFQTNAANTTVIVRATVTDPFGGYDIRWANLTMVGPSGNTILNNATMAKVGGTPVSFSNSYETSWNYSGAAPGRYNLTVWAVDNNGYYFCFYFMNYNYGVYAVNDVSFFFIGTPRFVNVMALDSTGVVLEGAEVQATLLDNVTDRNLTNPQGLANLSMQPGPYRFKVLWRGVMVASEPVNVTDNRTDSDPIIIYCWVYYPIFRAVDSRSLPLADAAVYMHYPNGTASILPFHTDQNGTFGIDQAPRGPYEVSVVWGSIEVNRTVVLVNGNETYDIQCAVYYLTIRAIDPHQAPILNAQIVVVDNATGIVADSKLTDLDGTAVFRLPRHFYDITVYWYEAVVFQGRAEPLLDGDRQLEIICWIYYLTVRSVDSAGVPIGNALTTVSIASNSKVMDSRLSSNDGEVQIRVPGGSYNISVRWQDIPVFSGTGIPVTEDSVYVASCSVFYLTVNAVDARGVPIENVQVQIHSVLTGKLLDARGSDAGGNLTSRLPATELSLEARWQDIVVNTTPSYTLEGTGVLDLRCSVFYLTVEAEDSLGVPVSAAQIKLSFANGGKLLDVQSTDPAGRIVSRLPQSELSLQAYWQDVLVNLTPSYFLAGDENGGALLTLDCWVYYLDVLALDSRSVPLDDAFIQVSLVTGRQVETRLSNDSGMVTVRVPIGAVNLTVTWSDVLVGVVEGYRVDSNHLLTVRCTVYYLDVTLTDSQDRTVSNAQVAFIRASTGKTMSTLTTGPRGNTTFRMPAESYVVTAVWQDQLVTPDTRYNLGQDGSLTVKCLIFYLTVRPVDSQGVLLENATVVFRQELTGNILDTVVTGAQGSVTARLPVGFHTIIIGWKDVEVNTTQNYELLADATLTITCRVFYLTVNPVDVDGIALAYADVLVYPRGRPDLPSSLRTNAFGLVVFRLPAQDYDLRVAWRAVEVGARDGYTLSADQQLRLACRVYYLTVKVVDRDGKGLEGVQLTVFTVRGGLVVDVADSALTNGSARMIFRLPVGEYKVVARYKTTYLLTPIDMSKAKSVQLQESMQLKLVFSDYPAPVYTTNAFFIALLVILLVIVAAATIYNLYRRYGRNGAGATVDGSDSGTVAGEAAAEAEDEEKEPAEDADGEKGGEPGRPGEEPDEDTEEEGGEPDGEDEDDGAGDKAEVESNVEPGKDRPTFPAAAPVKDPLPEAKAPEKEPVRPAPPEAKPKAPEPVKMETPAVNARETKDEIELIDDILKDLDK